MAGAAVEELRARRAKEVEDNVLAGCRAIRTTMVALAGYLYEFETERMWEQLGHDSVQAWLAQPEVEISYSHMKAITQAYRELVLERGVELSALEGVDLRRVQYALPAIRDGKAEVDEVLADCRTLGRRDMRTKYRGDPSAPINPGDGLVRCETCGSLVEPEQLMRAA